MDSIKKLGLSLVVVAVTMVMGTVFVRQVKVSSTDLSNIFAEDFYNSYYLPTVAGESVLAPVVYESDSVPPEEEVIQMIGSDILEQKIRLFEEMMVE